MLHLFISRNEDERLGLSVRGAGLSWCGGAADGDCSWGGWGGESLPAGVRARAALHACESGKAATVSLQEHACRRLSVMVGVQQQV